MERDIPNLGINIPAPHLRRFWTMLSHYHASICNYSELGRSLDLSDTTVKRYADILSSTFMIRLLQPWYENIGKRLVKRPKIYFRDSGLYHALLNIENEEALFQNPKLGASWEGFALEQVIRHYQADPEECFFWAVHQQSEVDLLILKGSHYHAFEFKYSVRPQITTSMQQALKDLKLDKLTIIYPGQHVVQLSSEITACGLQKFLASKKNPNHPSWAVRIHGKHPFLSLIVLAFFIPVLRFIKASWLLVASLWFLGLSVASLLLSVLAWLTVWLLHGIMLIFPCVGLFSFIFISTILIVDTHTCLRSNNK